MTTSTTTTVVEPVAVVEPARPLGVAILAVLIGIYGIILVIGALLWFFTAGHFAFAGDFPTFVGAGPLVAALVLLILGIIVLAVASGLYNLELWALALTIIVVVITMIATLLEGSLIWFLVALLLLIYLIAVSRHFW